MKKLLGYFKEFKYQSVLGPFFKLLEATFELLVPFVIGLIVDKGLGKSVNGSYPYADIPYIIKMCLILAGFGLVGFIFSITAQYFSAKAATGIGSRVRRDLFAKIQTLSYKDIDQIGASTMITRMTGDVDKLQTAVNLALRLFLRSPFIVFGAMITAYLIEPKVTGIFAVTIVALAIVVYAVMFICMPLYKKSQEKLDAVTLSTRENLTGVRVIRAFCQEEKEQQIFNTRNIGLTKERTFVGGIASITNPLTYILINLSIVWLIYSGAVQVSYGNLSQGNVLALYNLMGQILIELIKLANLIVTVTKGLASGKRIQAILDIQPCLSLKESEKADADKPFVLFEKVGLTYVEGVSPALDNINFFVQRGQTVGIIGGTGAGKSSLIHLIPHFYDATAGAVYVDGKNVKDKDVQEYLRSKIAIVPQKAILFKGTLRENLLWGKADATDEELWEALRLAQAEDFVLAKGGLDCKVLQGGKNFSGGQKQRLTIARALVRKPEILILDDSASALDYATDASLRRDIATLNTTVFIVSQRTSSVRNADKIIVLEDGKMVGEGTHDTLMQNCKVYREIYHSQYKSEQEVAV